MAFLDGTLGDSIRVKAYFKYGDERWTLNEARPGWDAESIIFDYTENNFSCDCNRSGGDLPCGDKVVLEKLIIDGIERDIT